MDSGVRRGAVLGARSSSQAASVRCTYTYTYANLTRSTQQPTETGPGGRLTRTVNVQDLKLSTFENGCSAPRPTARNLRRCTYRRSCRVRLLMSWEDTYVPTPRPSPSPSPRRSGRAAACVVYAARCSVLGARCSVLERHKYYVHLGSGYLNQPTSSTFQIFLSTLLLFLPSFAFLLKTPRAPPDSESG